MTQVNDSRVVHGHRISFVRAGSGPALLLLHGIGNNCQTWAAVIDRLAETHTVIAPDLLGHGDSDKPRGDYSVAAYANGVRDLMSVLDIERATVVGHSLGGGIALQFAYQFPERCERLVLVSSGGLGPELSAGLRAATLPGAELVLTRADRRLRPAAPRVPGPRPVGQAHRAAAGCATSPRPATRSSPSRTSRRGGRSSAPCAGVVDARGQAVSALDRLYLAHAVPMLVIWGSRDPIVPALHAETVRATGARTPASRSSDGAGHWAHLDDPDRFCDVLLDFLGEHRAGGARPRQLAAAARPGAARAAPRA